MKIDQTQKITRIAAIICAISAIAGLLLAFRSFSIYLLFMTFVNALLSFIFYRGTGKDRECLISVFVLMALHTIFQVFSGGSLSLSGGLFFLLRFGGNVAIIAYLLAISSDKKLPLAGAAAIVLANIWNSYQLILSFKNLDAMLGSFGGGLSSQMIWSLCLSLLTVVTYCVPIVITAILIAVSAIQIKNQEGGTPMQTPEKETSDIEQEKSIPTFDTTAESGTGKVPFKMPLPDLKSIDKKILIIAGIASAIVIALIVALNIFFSPINEFGRALNSGNISLAQEIFEANLRDDKFSVVADKALEAHLTSIKNSYINDESTYEAAQEAAKAVDSMMSAQSTLDSLKIIFDSKTALKGAEEAEESADFYAAIENYEKISPEDAKDYAIVDERISAAKTSLVAKALEDATSSVQTGNYNSAIATLTAVQEAGYATSEIDSALMESATEMVAACKAPADYYKAYDQIKELNLEGIQPLLSQAISSASAATISEAERLIDQQKYVDAFKVLALPKGDFITSEVESALKSCTDLAAGAILSEIETMKGNGQYKEAYELLRKTDSNLLTDAIKSAKDECEGLYMQSVLDSAAQLAGQGDYDGAIAVINEGQKLLSGQNLKDRAEEYRLEKLKAEQLVTVESTKVGQSWLYNEGYVVIKNRTDKVLKEYVVAMVMLDSNGYPVNNTYSHEEFRGYKNVHAGRADSVNVQPGGTYGGNSYWYIEGDCDKILACVVSAEFYDGTSWTNPYFDPWVKLYAEKPVK